MEKKKIHPGDYICYSMKNELGKVKRISDDNNVFAWFHTGDTASRISNNLFTLVLTQKEAEEMGEKSLIEYLEKKNFSNNYAIGEMVKKGEIK